MNRGKAAIRPSFGFSVDIEIASLRLIDVVVVKGYKLLVPMFDVVQFSLVYTEQLDAVAPSELWVESCSAHGLAVLTRYLRSC